jgi:hypothetical protein
VAERCNGDRRMDVIEEDFVVDELCLLAEPCKNLGDVPYGFICIACAAQALQP